MAKSLVSALCVLGFMVASGSAFGSSILFTGTGTNTPAAPLGGVVTGDLVGGFGAYVGSGTTSQSAPLVAYSVPNPTLGHGGFNLNFVNTGATGAVTHDFSFTLTNSTSTGLESPLNPGGVGRNIQNIEFELINPGGTVGFTDFPVGGTPLGSFTNGIFYYTNGAGNQVARFGGHAGGGAAIAQGGSATFNFSIDAADAGVGGDVFNLRVTANPEPGTMILGGLAMIPLGIAVRRRRQRKVSETEVQV